MMGNYKVGKPCKRLVVVGRQMDEDGEMQDVKAVCGAPTVIYSWREIDGLRYSDTTCSVCDAAPAEEDQKCDDCGQPTASDEGLCYECQCAHHGIDFDMDGAGWMR